MSADEENLQQIYVIIIIIVVVVVTLSPIAVECSHDEDTDEVQKSGGKIYAFWGDWSECLFGCICPVWQLASSTAEASGGSCLCNCVVLLCCPIFGHCCVAQDMSIANTKWGGRPNCFYRWYCIVCCPQLSSMQMARAVKRRRLINSGQGQGQVVISAFKSHPAQAVNVPKAIVVQRAFVVAEP